MRRVHGRIVAIGAALLLAISLGSAAAWSYYKASGTGTGAATTGSTQQLTLSPAAPTTQLYPGGQAAVQVTVTNPNPGPVRLTSLSLATGQANGGFAVDNAHTGCAVSSLTFTTQNDGGAGWTVAGNGSTTISLANALAMSVGAANACQGAAITVYLTAGAS